VTIAGGDYGGDYGGAGVTAARRLVHLRGP
jgi:hypothetical protein